MLKIPLNKAACMQHLLMLQTRGYGYWNRGEVRFDKALPLYEKLRSLYPIDATHDAKAWARKTGKYACHLVMYPHDKDREKLMFWLLATAGKPPAGMADIHQREKLSSIADKDCGLTWRDQYIVAGRKDGDRERRTWQMQAQYMNHMRAEMEQACIEGAPAVKELWVRMLRRPMFGGIRDQVIELDDYCRRRWKNRRRSVQYPIEELKLPIMPRINIFGESNLEILVKEMQQRAELARMKAAEQSRSTLDDILSD